MSLAIQSRKKKIRFNTCFAVSLGTFTFYETTWKNKCGWNLVWYENDILKCIHISASSLSNGCWNWLHGICFFLVSPHSHATEPLEDNEGLKISSARSAARPKKEIAGKRRRFEDTGKEKKQPIFGNSVKYHQEGHSGKAYADRIWSRSDLWCQKR